ncbi:MAG TPA: hypothetical protein DCS23_01735 [Candidatus Yonathbacteria bacterium]|nr:hypothetical protein [Candidatus Yonathbacteria bacterium]
MKVISTDPDGSALIEFENVHCNTNVIGETAPVRAVVSISRIPDLIRIGQQGRRAVQKLNSLFAVIPRV